MNRFFPRLLVLLLDPRRVVLDDICETLPLQDLLPEIVGLHPVRIRRIPPALVEPLVERQEPRLLPRQRRAELHVVLVHREMRDARSLPEKRFLRAAVVLVLPHRIVHRLLGQIVLQLEGRHRQPIDEQPQVERVRHVVRAIPQLPRHREDVLPMLDRRVQIPRRRRAIEERHILRLVLDPLAQHIDDSPLRHLTLDPAQELLPRRPIHLQRERLHHLRLRHLQELDQLDRVEHMQPVVVFWITLDEAPARYAVAGSGVSPTFDPVRSLPAKDLARLAHRR